MKLEEKAIEKEMEVIEMEMLLNEIPRHRLQTRHLHDGMPKKAQVLGDRFFLNNRFHVDDDDDDDDDKEEKKNGSCDLSWIKLSSFSPISPLFTSAYGGNDSFLDLEEASSDFRVVRSSDSSDKSSGACRCRSQVSTAPPCAISSYADAGSFMAHRACELSSAFSYFQFQHCKGGTVHESSKTKGSARGSSSVWPINRDALYVIAKEQQGCRFLQSMIAAGKEHVGAVFIGVIDHAAELMVHPFGNYLMQRMLEVCDVEQRLRLVQVLTDKPLALVDISLNIHGTRAVQKLVERLETSLEIGLVVSALQPGLLELVADINGNHVVQRCLLSLRPEDNESIFATAAAHCANMGMQRHGCCVLQRCIAYSTGKHRQKLVSAVAGNGLRLAQDQFGNYVVQYVLELQVQDANTSMARQFEGHYVHLATQKFSSNVVEKCLTVFVDADKATIIRELLSSTVRFDWLLQHPFANYVIYAALQNSKGSLHGALISAIRPHTHILRGSPYCKRILSRASPKKMTTTSS